MSGCSSSDRLLMAMWPSVNNAVESASWYASQRRSLRTVGAFRRRIPARRRNGARLRQSLSEVVLSWSVGQIYRWPNRRPGTARHGPTKARPV